MESARPPFSCSDAAAIAADAFGLQGSATELPAELDRCFLIDAADDGSWVLKIAHPSVSETTLACQQLVLERLAATELRHLLPTVREGRGGGSLLRLVGPDGKTYRVRLLSYLDGVPLATVAQHPDQLLCQVGRVLGTLDRLLLDLDHPGAHRHLPWDLTRTLELAPSLDLLPTDDQRQLVGAVLDAFRDRVQPHLPKLRRSIIHNDANDHNILVSNDGLEARPKSALLLRPARKSRLHGINSPPILEVSADTSAVSGFTSDRTDATFSQASRRRHVPVAPLEPTMTGLIDFGDSVHTVTVAEPAIACAYLMLGKTDPWAAAARVIAGYQSVLPLTQLEQDLLPHLVTARLATSLLMAARARLREPDNEYLQVSQAPAWRLLETLLLRTTS